MENCAISMRGGNFNERQYDLRKEKEEKKCEHPPLCSHCLPTQKSKEPPPVAIHHPT